MKKYVITALCIINSLRCMEQPLIVRQPAREPREWDAKAYDEGNTFQTAAFLHYIQQNNIKVDDLTVLDVGCGTGKLCAMYSHKAKHVHGFDASQNMINFAQNKYKYVENLSFEHCFAEDFKPKEFYQLAIASFCIHWIEDKKQAFQCINNSLQTKGEFFATVRTKSNPKPLELIAAIEMISFLEKIISAISGKSIMDLLGFSDPSNEKLKTMLDETGFEILKCEEQSFDYTIKNRDELKQLQWPQVSSRPIMQWIPDILIESLFDKFIDILITKLPKSDTGDFLERNTLTIIHARKKS